MKYIDVSTWQGKIDWEKVKPNIDGAIIRAGYGQNVIDSQFIRNITECNRLDIPCGAYWFSYAYTSEMAKKEADYLIKAVEPYKINLPLAFDFEYDSIKNMSKHNIIVTKDLITEFVYQFCTEVEEAGYWCLNYTNPDFLKRYLDEKVPKRFGLWLAKYTNNVPDLTKKPHVDCQIWQWGTSIISGINGVVDTNESYVDFNKIIKEAELNNLNESELEIALKWCKENELIDDTMAYVNDLALLIYRYHKKVGGK